MENWGLILYKEQYLIGDESSHPRDVLEIVKTVAHEIGHQFFGKYLQFDFIIWREPHLVLCIVFHGNIFVQQEML